jgi:hypothetical protein
MSGEGGQNGLRLLIAEHGAVNVVNQQVQVIFQASLHKNSYLWIYALYNPVRNAFDCGKSITKWEGVGLCKSRLFEPCEMASSP